MPPTPQHGYLVLSDISGFTAFMAETELAHATSIISGLLELIANRFKPLLSVSKFEGDAVFAFAPKSAVTRGETLVELIESTYIDFRDRLVTIHRQTTCTCGACRRIPELDLKFMVHFGTFVLQPISGREEVVGSDVNLVHRLLKNRVVEQSGYKAYVLFTIQALQALKLGAENFFALTESFEHLGAVETRSLNLRDRYETLIKTRDVAVTSAEAIAIDVIEFAASPIVVWDWLNDSHKRPLYATRSGLKFKDVAQISGRRGVGAETLCVHGESIDMREIVLDWRPVQSLTVEQLIFGVRFRITYALKELQPNVTRLEVRVGGRPGWPGFFGRTAAKLLISTVYPLFGAMRKMGVLIEEAQQQTRPLLKAS